MTQQEFTQRVNVEVSNKEFEAINEVYMNSDLDKDEFCKMWVKMNKTRVAKAQAEQKAQEEEMKKMDYLYNLYHKYNDYNNDFKLYWEILSDKEQNQLTAYGFSMTESRYFYSTNQYLDAPKTMSTIKYDIYKYIHKAA
jgi:hypothetical protein